MRLRRNIQSKRRVSFGLILAALAPLTLPAATTTETWNGSSTANWALGANWTPNSIPSQQTTLTVFNGSAANGNRTINIAGTSRNSGGARFDSSGASGDGFIFTTATANIQIRISTDGVINNDDDTQEYRVPILFTSSGGAAANGLTTPINAVNGNIGFNINGFAASTTASALDTAGTVSTFAFNAAVGKTITVGSASTPGIISGINGGRVTKDGLGTLTLAGTSANTYIGGTVINAGVVNANKANALGSSASSLFLTGGTLHLGANNQTVGAVTNAGGVIDGTATITGSKYELQGGTISAKLGGTGINLVQKSGTSSLGAVNTYSGTTTINGGTLQLSIANAIASSSGVVMNGGKMDPAGFNQIMSTTTLTLGGSGAIDYSGGSSEVDFANSSSLTWSGNLDLLSWDDTLDKLRFGTDATGLTAGQLALISHDGLDLGSAQIDSTGFIFFAIPEPSTISLLVLGGLGLAAGYRRKI